MKCHTPGKTERTGVQDRSNARKYAVDVWSRNTDASHQAASYIRVLEYPGPLFAGRSKKFAHCSDIFSIADSDVVQALYEFVTEQQRLGEHGIFRDVEKPSYWRSRFYSAALKDYMRFLQQFKYEEKLWAANGYPLFTEHKAAHDAFVKTVRELYLDLDKNGVTDDFAKRVENEVTNWLINHIQGADTKGIEWLTTRINNKFMENML